MDKEILGVAIDQLDSNQHDGGATELSELELACVGGGIGDTIL
jgi:hypothetical protein